MERKVLLADTSHQTQRNACRHVKMSEVLKDRGEDLLTDPSLDIQSDGPESHTTDCFTITTVVN